MATTEVAEVFEALDFLQEVNIYGVTVPGAQAWKWGSRPAHHPKLIMRGHKAFLVAASMAHTASTLART